ncbi:MAG TPA: TlpA disulfide reductase family protein [Acidobacteriota bacterium]|nr:TlpA disulfide reductase family protein [Acidobacteriota bacterium]
MRNLWGLLVTASLLLLAGCAEAQPDRSEQQIEEVTLEAVTYDEWLRRLESMQGEIVVVDMWATWCIPCIERFPHMVELHEKYAGQGVRFVSMCLNDRDDPEAIKSAEAFLKRQNATFTNYLMDENVLDAFEKLGILGIPAVYIYDREGNLRYRLTGDNPNDQFTDADVEEAIVTLMNG